MATTTDTRTVAMILCDQLAEAERRERKRRWTWARKRAARLAVAA